jgi:hypothetical protein
MDSCITYSRAILKNMCYVFIEATLSRKLTAEILIILKIHYCVDYRYFPTCHHKAGNSWGLYRLSYIIIIVVDKISLHTFIGIKIILNT